MRVHKFIGILLCSISFTLSWAQEDVQLEAAKQLFAQFVDLEKAYDTKIADLYADDALIKSRRAYPMGAPRDTIIPAPTYKASLRQLTATAKSHGERNTYSQVSYTREGESVRIDASRFSELKKRTSPISLLVGRNANGKWLIYEELSESQ